MRRIAGLRRSLTSLLPEAAELPSEAWAPRHRWITRLLWLHVPVLLLYSLAQGFGPLHAMADVVAVVAFAAFASRSVYDQRTRSCLASAGLMTASAVLVHISGGQTEMHFHFFVMLPVISLYHDWRPFLLSIGFVAFHHGVMGVIRPKDVFDSPAALHDPLLWAGIHTAFVLAASAVCILSWRIIEESNRAARIDLEQSERRFRALVEHSTDVVLVVDAAGVVLYDSPSICRVLGYPLGERLGTNVDDMIHQDDLERVSSLVAGVQEDSGTVTGVELRVRHRDGTYRWIEAAITNLLQEPGIGGIVGNFREITDRKTLERELSHQAFHDSLTGLANRALLLDRLDHVFETSNGGVGTGPALLFLDLDDFKTVNDGLGHVAGDRILRVAAERIQEAVRPGDTASRLGGDEFAVLVEHVDEPADLYEIGARLLQAVSMPIDVDDTLVAISASIGIAVSGPGDDAGGLLRNADLAMYRAKAAGKGRFEVYETGMHEKVLARMATKADLRRAVEAHEFEPHFQPIVELSTGRVIGVEALARWNHPSQGLVPPSAFITLAEETGLIVELGHHILREACMHAAAWRDAFGDAAPATMSVNLSPRQIQSGDIVARIAEILAESGLPANRLTLEITEGVLLERSTEVSVTLGQLKALGIRIALDDFGTGYSSLSYLDQFPVDIVKIDKSFIDSLADPDASPSHLVSAIVNLGAVLGLEVTAEGIETASQLRRLTELGCTSGQGYLFSKPVPAERFLALLRQARPAAAPSSTPPERTGSAAVGRAGASAAAPSARPLPRPGQQ